MSSPSGGPTEYDLPDQLPADLEEHVEGASGLRRATGWLVLERHALKSRASGKTWAFYLFSTREQLHAQFYPLSNGTTGKGLGVIVVNGPSLARPVIIGRSPSGKRLHYWVWQGPRLEFADDEWEIVKTLGTLDSETKTLEDWDQDDDDEEDTNVAETSRAEDIDEAAHTTTKTTASVEIDPESTRLEILAPRRSSRVQRKPSLRQKQRVSRKRPASVSPERSVSSQTHIVVVQFIGTNGEVLRARAWHQCNSVKELFAQAIVGRLLSGWEKGSILVASVGGEEYLLIQGDEEDFGALKAAVDNAVAQKQDAGDEGVVDVEVRQLDG